jgi:predicted Zn-dependent protease
MNRSQRILTSFLLSAILLPLASAVLSPLPALAQFKSSYAQASQTGQVQPPPSQQRQQHWQRPQQRQAASAAGGVYPEFRSSFGAIRWVKEQMPLKVYVAPGSSLDTVLDPRLGASVMNVDDKEHWPDIIADLVSDPQKLQSLPLAHGYSQEHYQAAIDGINAWKAFEKEGLFSFTLTNDPGDADIYVVWTNHFVNQLGLGLFANDIRGYTAKRSFPYSAVLAHKQIQFRPVVSVLRTVDGHGNPMELAKMKASATHEFGHALGIEGHSNNPNDIMSVYYGHGAISAGDAATIRYLYHLTPDLIP